MDHFLATAIILIGIALAGGFLLGKIFKIERKIDNRPLFAKRLQFALLAVIYIAFIVSVIIFATKVDDFDLVYLLIPFFISVSIVRGLIEWLYNRNAKKWIYEIFGICVFLVLGILVIYFV